MRWNTLRIFLAESEADASRLCAAVEWHNSDRLLRCCFVPEHFCPLSITPFLPAHLRPCFMNDPLLETKPCWLAKQFLEVFDVRIRQSLWAWSGRKHIAYRRKLFWRRSHTLRALK